MPGTVTGKGVVNAFSNCATEGVEGALGERGGSPRSIWLDTEVPDESRPVGVPTTLAAESIPASFESSGSLAKMLCNALVSSDKLGPATPSSRRDGMLGTELAATGPLVSVKERLGEVGLSVAGP